VGEKVITGLKRIQYRGYDSFGFVYGMDADVNGSGKTVNSGGLGSADGRLETFRSTELIDTCDAVPDTAVMLGHTRWATHGRVTLANCHPHCARTSDFALVHNGIVENFQNLKDSLDETQFVTDTDTEVVVRLLENAMENLKHREGESIHVGLDRTQILTRLRFKALEVTMAQLRGRNTVAILFSDGEIIAYRQGSPLVIGMNENEFYLASDALSFAVWADQCFVIEDGVCVSIRKQGVYLKDHQGTRIYPEWQSSGLASEDLDMDGYRHYMLKEIMQQWRTLGCQSLKGNSLNGAIEAARSAHTVLVTGAGGAYYTALQIAWILKTVAGIRAIAVQAYEIEAAACLIAKGDLIIAVSQSGETADTLQAVRQAKSWGIKVASTTNMPMSTLEREADFCFENQLGAEVCVLSTKSATAQIAFGYLFSHELRGLEIGAQKGLDLAVRNLTHYLTDDLRVLVRDVAQTLINKQHVFLLGREENVGTALIGALNIKEATYLHAEAFAAGELKHGVIALIEDQTPVIVFVPEDDAYMINVSAEVKARGAHVIGIGARDNPLFDDFIALPKVSVSGQQSREHDYNARALAAVVNIIPCQLLAYELGVLRGVNPDRPRNLAKSVTVQ